MVRAWYMESTDDEDTVVRAPDNGKLLGPETVTTITGVRIYNFQATENIDHPELLKLKQDLGIRTEDVLVIEKGSPDYEKQAEMFGVEHLHPDDEIRWVVAGVTYFDVRTPNDRWVRLELSQGDVIALPPGIYHKLVLQPDVMYLKFRRYFANEALWVAHLRPADDHPARIKYLEAMAAL